MGLGSTAKKLQQLADQADELYRRFAEVREQVTALRTTVEDTDERVRSIERELVAQRALLEAVAEANDVDVEETLEAVDDASTDTETDEPADAGTGPETSPS